MRMLAWKRAVLVASFPLALPLLGGCKTVIPFEKAVTPSGEPCSDMPVIPAGQTVDRPYHRLRPVASALTATTEAERLESLRRAACGIQADGVIEAANEEARLPDNTGYVTRASGTAIVWRRGPSKATPLQSTIPSPGSPSVPSSTSSSTGNAEPEESSTTPEPVKPKR